MSVIADPELERLSAEAPSIPGLRFRRLRLPDDIAPLAALHNLAAEADGVEERDSADDWAHWLEHPSGCDPATDALVGDLGGRIVAYGQARWTDDNDGGRDYGTGGEVAPAVRGRGLGRAVLRHNERRLGAIAVGHPAELAKRLECWAFDSQVARIHLLESEGYIVARYFFEMQRPTLDEIPGLSIPPGLEVRPVGAAHHHQIWDADVEAFRDEWGGMDVSDGTFVRRFSGPNFRPDLWQVAWDGDQVAGVVMVEIMTAYNEQTGALRGLLSGVSVRRLWRRRGLARALVANALRALRNEGMTSAMLGVDAENPTGALGVYEANGFAVAHRGRTYRKPLVVAATESASQRARTASSTSW